MAFKSLIVFCLVSISACYAEGETLVLLDNLAIKETHSMFFKTLKGRYAVGYITPV